MPRSATPSKGASTPKGSRTDRQKIEIAARPLAGEIIKQLEDLIAAGFTLKAAPMVFNGGCFLRDLAPVTLDRVLSLVSPSSGTGASPAPGRRPITFTPAQEHARDVRQEAAEVVGDAYSIHHHLAGQADRLEANPVIPRAYVAARRALQHRAARDLVVDRARFDRARDREHLAHGLPALRPRHENQSLHRGVNGKRRRRRYWDSYRNGKALHKALRGPGVDLSDLGEHGLLYFAGLAAYSTPGGVKAATVNLTDDMDARARKSGKPASWMLERVTRRLEQALGRALPVVVVMELNKAKLLHAHLIIAGILPGERDAVKAALKLAGGKGYRGKQVVLRGPQPDSGWCSYGAEDFVEPWPWAHRVAATSDLRQAAEVAFRDVLGFIAERKHSEKAPEDKSKLIFVSEKDAMVNYLIRSPCIRSLVRVTPDCGHKQDVYTCREKRSVLTRLQTCSKGWKLGRVPRWDSS